MLAPSVVVEIVAGSGCDASADAMDARIASRGVTVIKDGAATAAPRARLRVVARSADGLEGTLVLTRPDGTTSTRVVTASTCDEVHDALAFTLSLALENSDAPDPVTPPPPATPLAETPVRPPPVAAPVTTSPVSPDRVSTPTDDPLRWELAAGAGAGVITAASPTAAPALIVWFMAGGQSRARIFAPAVFAGGRIGFATVTDAGAGARVTSALQAATVDVCPVRVGLGSAEPAVLALRPCLRGVLGRSQARSEGFQGATLDDHVFATIGLGARMEAHLGGPLRLMADFDVGVPFERSTYFVGHSRVFQTPAVTLGATLGLGVHFL